MGKRRIRNLHALGHKDVIGFDPRRDRRVESTKKYHVKTYSTIDEALKVKPDAMIISTPPDLHTKYANIAIKNNIHFFTEVNLFSNEIAVLMKKIKNKKIVGEPSCTMIFHPVIKQLKKILENKQVGKILLINHHFGHYLPDWHPWEDYRKFYVSRRKTGAAREIVPFELVWLRYLFPRIKTVYANITKISKLDVDIDDIYQILFELETKILCNITIDVITIPSVKETKIIGEKGTIICNYSSGEVRVNKGKEWIIFKMKMGKVAPGYKGNTAPESLYEEEIQSFIDAIKKKKKYPHTLQDELEILETLDYIENSSKEGRKIFLNLSN
jgi:predicted dehydrogenase